MSLVRGENGGIYEPDVTIQDRGGQIKSDSLLKDFGDKYNHDKLYQDHVDREKDEVPPKDHECGVGSIATFTSGDCDDKDNHVKLLEDHEVKAKYEVPPKGHESRDESVNTFIFKDFGDRDKHDVFMKDHRGEDQHEIGDESIATYTSRGCGDKDDRGKLLEDLGVNEKYESPPKVHKGRDEPVPTFRPSAKVSKKRTKNKRCFSDSKQLFQAYLNMIPYKKKNLHLPTGNQIQSPMSAKPNTVCERSETSIAKYSTPQIVTPPKKLNEEEQISRRSFKKLSHHKAEVWRRDALVASSEMFLPIIDSVGCSKTSQKSFGDLKKLEVDGQSELNETSKSKAIILHSNCNESVDLNLKRSAEHMLHSQSKIVKKNKQYIHKFKKVQNGIDLEVVIMKDAQGSPMANVDLDNIRRLFNAEVMRFELKNEKTQFVPRFSGFWVDHNHKWIKVNCIDQETMNWLLNWTPSNNHQSFTIVKSKQAPWRLIRVCITIRKDKPEVERVVKLLTIQNSMLNVADWRHVKTAGCQGEWKLHFLLTSDELKQLDRVGWMVYFELDKSAAKKKNKTTT